MMNINFNILFFSCLALWITGLSLCYVTHKKAIKTIGLVLIIGGIMLIGAFITNLWIKMDRPPLRTLGETRLWYSFFLPLMGIILYIRWKIKWMPLFSVLLAIIFFTINFLHPENFSKALMPALQSPWFVPHVVVYIFAYSILTASTIMAIKALVHNYRSSPDHKLLLMIDNIVYIGFAFLTFGLLFGAFWAKEAWGDYWTWDPKETWAFITWTFYLIYIHIRIARPKSRSTPLWILAISFIILIICWFGVNYLPSAASSVHTYS